jgi:hypothetical protein
MQKTPILEPNVCISNDMERNPKKNSTSVCASIKWT